MITRSSQTQGHKSVIEGGSLTSLEQHFNWVSGVLGNCPRRMEPFSIKWGYQFYQLVRSCIVITDAGLYRFKSEAVIGSGWWDLYCLWRFSHKSSHTDGRYHIHTHTKSNIIALNVHSLHYGLNHVIIRNKKFAKVKDFYSLIFERKELNSFSKDQKPPKYYKCFF